eukprot:178936-Prorocentrum_minimum.AAC.1
MTNQGQQPSCTVHEGHKRPKRGCYQRREHPGFPGASSVCDARVPWTNPSPVQSAVVHCGSRGERSRAREEGGGADHGEGMASRGERAERRAHRRTHLCAAAAGPPLHVLRHACARAHLPLAAAGGDAALPPGAALGAPLALRRRHHLRLPLPLRPRLPRQNFKISKRVRKRVRPFPVKARIEIGARHGVRTGGPDRGSGQGSAFARCAHESGLH